MELTTIEEGQFLDATSSRVDEEIRSLFIQRALLRRRGNSIRDRTYILPPEILATIFEHLVYHNVLPAVSLAAVCYRWRQVIWTSPSLWTSITLDPKQSGVWQLFNLHLANAKDAPISIHLSTHHGFGFPLTPMLALLQSVFLNCAESICRLDLGPIDKPVWDVIAPYSSCTEFPRLEAAKLDFKSGIEVDFQGGLFCRSPRLRAIGLGNPFPGIERYLPLHQITSLSLRGTNSRYSLFLLSQCPNLANFHARDPSLRTLDDEAFELETSTTLRDLISFRWENGEIPRSATFITDIHLPSVQELFWDTPLEPDSNYLWKPFFTTMSAVKVLECSYSAGTFDLLDSLPSLEAVHIRFDHFFDHLQDITYFLSRLVWKEKGDPLPNLTQLTITLEDKDKVVSKERLPFHDNFVQMIKSRRCGESGDGCAPLRKLSLELFVLVVWGTWHRRLVDALYELRREGLDVSITQ